jgi:hypothetical protein
MLMRAADSESGPAAVPGAELPRARPGQVRLIGLGQPRATSPALALPRCSRWRAGRRLQRRRGSFNGQAALAARRHSARQLGGRPVPARGVTCTVPEPALWGGLVALWHGDGDCAASLCTLWQVAQPAACARRGRGHMPVCAATAIEPRAFTEREPH